MGLGGRSAYWNRSRSHRATVTSSPGSQLLPTRAPRAGQIKHRPRTSPGSLTDTLDNSRTTWIVLPRLEDVVEDGKHLLRVHGAMEWLVVDVAHAFCVVAEDFEDEEPSTDFSAHELSLRQTVRFLSATVAQKTDLRSFCGKLSFVDGMFPTLGVCGVGLELLVAVGARPLWAITPSLLPSSRSAGQGLPCRSIVGSRGQLHCYRCVFFRFGQCIACKFQACGVVRYSTHEEPCSHAQSHHRFVQAQHLLGSSCLPRGRAALVARYAGVGETLRSMVRLSNKSADLNVAWELALDAVLGFLLSEHRDSHSRRFQQTI